MATHPFSTTSKLTLTLLITLSFQALLTQTLSPCRTSCGGIPINYPFGVDDGCGAPQFRNMFSCNATTALFFVTPSGNYKVQSIDYDKKTITIYDPAMSTCSILQPHHDFVMSDVQYAIIPPSHDTVFAILNCSIDSPVANHYRYLCYTDLAGHSCEELYNACNAFKIFHMQSNATAPPCCFTSYSTVKFMTMNMLDCTHYTMVLNGDRLKGIGPLDWVYGIKLSYSVPDNGCEVCKESGGACGFDAESEASMCLCSTNFNATKQCGDASTGGVEAVEVAVLLASLLHDFLNSHSCPPLIVSTCQNFKADDRESCSMLIQYIPGAAAGSFTGGGHKRTSGIFSSVFSLALTVLLCGNLT